jgi:hypothetical protein
MYDATFLGKERFLVDFQSFETKYNKVFAFLNGKAFILDGVSGYFRHLYVVGKFPCVNVFERLFHVADEKGRQTNKYREVSFRLQDDYLSNITNAIEFYTEVARAMGYRDSWQPSKEVVPIYAEGLLN